MRSIIVCGNTDLQRLEGFLVSDASAVTENMLAVINALNLGGYGVGFILYPI